MTNRMVALAVLAATLGISACASTAGTAAKPVASATPAGCVRDTGSRVPATGVCPAFGRTYTQEDLARTGQTRASDALSLLDPTITARP
jgi:hypothetical protein